ncbi:hypothetical protein [Pseudomonas shirazensis]
MNADEIDQLKQTLCFTHARGSMNKSNCSQFSLQAGNKCRRWFSLLLDRGTMFPDWRGNLLVPALKERAVRRVLRNGRQVVGQQLLLGADARCEGCAGRFNLRPHRRA